MGKQGNKKGPERIIQRNETHRPKRHAIFVVVVIFLCFTFSHTHTHRETHRDTHVDVTLVRIGADNNNQSKPYNLDTGCV